MAFGDSSRFVIIVAPVVVIPDMLSKKESVKESCISEKKKGIDPNIATPTQDNEVNKNACCVFML